MKRTLFSNWITFRQRSFSSEKGVTLIELLVATAILGLIVIALATIGVSIMRAQRQANALQALQDDLRFALEVAGKEIRLARVSKSASEQICVPQNDSFVFSSSTLKFINDKGECIRYSLDAGGAILRQVDGDLDGVFEAGGKMTSDLTIITGLRFEVTGQAESGKQPRITLVLKAEKRSASGQVEADLELQTTLTQRELDVL
jgi:type II secretory pathway pseudopilin PulG